MNIMLLIAAAIVVGALWLFGSDESPVEAQAMTPEEAQAAEELANAYLDATSDSPELQQLAIGNFRQVAWRYEDGSVHEEIVHLEHVERMIQAVKDLHYQPGVNPHNGASAAKAVAIYVGKPNLDGPYWWTTPGLKDNYDFDHGAMTIDWDHELVWERPDGS